MNDAIDKSCVYRWLTSDLCFAANSFSVSSRPLCPDHVFEAKRPVHKHIAHIALRLAENLASAFRRLFLQPVRIRGLFRAALSFEVGHDD